MKVRFVCATRLSQAEFFEKSALGRSCKLYKPNMGIHEMLLFPNNTQGLPDVYNSAIVRAEKDPAILIFVHDDVYLNDFFWRYRIINALNSFDIVGVAGNIRRMPKQPSWYFLDVDTPREDAGYLTGIVAHGFGFPPGDGLTVFGDAEQECKLLDGVLIAVHSETLIKHDLRFDPQFKFHFYDMDFCRQAELKGLKMGTCRLSLIHESGGDFGSTWRQVYQQYLLKYGE